MEHKAKYEKMQPMTHPEAEDDEAYERLAMAVVQSAAEEYMNAYRSRFKKRVAPDSEFAKTLDRTIREDEHFFYSRRFDILTKGQMNADALVDRLQYLAMNTQRTTFGTVMH